MQQRNKDFTSEYQLALIRNSVFVGEHNYVLPKKDARTVGISVEFQTSRAYVVAFRSPNLGTAHCVSDKSTAPMGRISTKKKTKYLSKIKFFPFIPIQCQHLPTSNIKKA